MSRREAMRAEWGRPGQRGDGEGVGWREGFSRGATGAQLPVGGEDEGGQKGEAEHRREKDGLFFLKEPRG